MKFQREERRARGWGEGALGIQILGPPKQGLREGGGEGEGRDASWDSDVPPASLGSGGPARRIMNPAPDVAAELRGRRASQGW